MQGLDYRSCRHYYPPSSPTEISESALVSLSNHASRAVITIYVVYNTAYADRRDQDLFARAFHISVPGDTGKDSRQLILEIIAIPEIWARGLELICVRREGSVGNNRIIPINQDFGR
jgi:hypothetical protein